MKIYDVKKFKIEMTCALVKIKNPFGFLQSVYFESVFLKVYFFSVIPKLAFFESVFLLGISQILSFIFLRFLGPTFG